MKKTIISLLLPTRGRVPGCEKLIRSIIDTVKDLSMSEILFYLDDDDPSLPTYKEMFAKYESAGFGTFLYTIGKRISPGKAWNIIAEKCVGDVLYMCNDDLVFLAKHWDERLRKETDKYPDGIYCMFFNDSIWHGRKCTFIMVGRRWYETLGYFTPTIFEGLYNDTWVEDIAKRAGRLIYISDWDGPTMRHEHWTRQPGRPVDETTSFIRREGIGARDGKVYKDSENARQIEANKLIKSFKENI